MYDKDIQYHLNYRQKDLYTEAKEARLARLAQTALPKAESMIYLLSSALKLSIVAFIVIKLAEMVYS